MSQVLQHVIGAITPASEASAAAAGARVARAGVPMFERLARSLAAAQHASVPRAARRRIVIAAGDHGCGDPGIAMGADHPTVIAARAVADGSAALCQVARQAAHATPIVLVDAGTREPAHMPPIAIALGRGPSRDLTHEPAMTVVDAILAVEAGIALSLSLAEPTLDGELAAPGLDVLALGAIGLGSEVASAALLGAFTGRRSALAERDDIALAAMDQGIALRNSPALELVAHAGGPDTALLAGLILGAASTNVAVILDSYATGAAALVACALAPEAAGYLLAAHRGSFTMPAILDHLGLSPIYEVGLGHGEGTGAAMILPLLDQVVALALG